MGQEGWGQATTGRSAVSCRRDSCRPELPPVGRHQHWPLVLLFLLMTKQNICFHSILRKHIYFVTEPFQAWRLITCSMKQHGSITFVLRKIGHFLTISVNKSVYVHCNSPLVLTLLEPICSPISPLPCFSWSSVNSLGLASASFGPSLGPS